MSKLPHKMISAITTLPCKKLHSFLHTWYIDIPPRKKPGIENIGGYKEYYRIIKFKCNANSKATMNVIRYNSEGTIYLFANSKCLLFA